MRRDIAVLASERASDLSKGDAMRFILKASERLSWIQRSNLILFSFSVPKIGQVFVVNSYI